MAGLTEHQRVKALLVLASMAPGPSVLFGWELGQADHAGHQSRMVALVSTCCEYGAVTQRGSWWVRGRWHAGMLAGATPALSDSAARLPSLSSPPARGRGLSSLFSQAGLWAPFVSPSARSWCYCFLPFFIKESGKNAASTSHHLRATVDSLVHSYQGYVFPAHIKVHTYTGGVWYAASPIPWSLFYSHFRKFLCDAEVG